MRTTLALLALLIAVMGPARAQSWQSEFGIQSGFTRIKPAGTDAADHLDVFGVPGFNLPGLVPAGASLFAILPWKKQIAIEINAGAIQGDAIALLGDGTFFDFGARGNYAITPNVYAAAGGRLNWLETGGQHQTQLGVQVAIGYRFGFVAGLRGRVEANASFFGNTDLLSPFNTYGVELGVSRQLGAARGRSAPVRRTGAWQPVLGIQGGYSRAHAVGGGGDVTTLAIPGLGGSLTILGVPAGPPVVFAILPVANKFAIEPGIDFTRIQTQGNTLAGANLSARVNYAVSGGWYAGVGGNLIYLKVTGADAETVTGLNLGWGYRFPLMAGLGGRVELDYTMMAHNADLGSPAFNTFGLQFAATMPLR